jgi:hypothetical protein
MGALGLVQGPGAAVVQVGGNGVKVCWTRLSCVCLVHLAVQVGASWAWAGRRGQPEEPVQVGEGRRRWFVFSTLCFGVHAGGSWACGGLGRGSEGLGQGTVAGPSPCRHHMGARVKDTVGRGQN